jgi:hypothetical protein
VQPSQDDTVYLSSSNASFVLSDVEPNYFGPSSTLGWQLTFEPSQSQPGPQSSTLTFFQPYAPSGSLCPPYTVTATGTSVAP